MNMEKAKAVYEKALEMEVKQQGTIKRHEDQLAKKVAKFEKSYKVSLEGQELTKLDAFKWPDGKTNPNSEMYWAAADIEHKAADVIRSKGQLPERERITAEAFEKLGKWEKRTTVFAELPAIILEFAERYKVQCIEWLLEGAANYRARMKEIDADATLDRKGRNAKQAAAKAAYGGAIRAVAYYHSEAAQRVEAEKISEKNRVSLLELLAARVAEKCGRVTDAAGLSIGQNGEINGRVIGDKGGATIKTIAAGGWNIQCYHYRVLVQD